MAKNYPSFFPIIYHDISIEIPAPFRGLARRYYYGWQFLICGGCVLSTIAGIIFWASASGSSGSSYTVILSGTPISYIGQRLLVLFLFPISYFWLLYWPLYKALKKNSSIAWIIFWISNISCLLWLSLLLSGVWPSDLSWYFISNSALLSTIFGVLSLVDKGIWGLCLLWWIFTSMKAYMVYMYEAGPVHAKLTSQTTEMETVQKTGPPPPPTKRPIWGTTKVAGQDVNVSVDSKTAASVAKTAYTSGAAGQLAAGTKPKMGADGQMSFDVDPKAAKQAAGTMYKSGAASELAAGTTVSTSGGWGFGGSKAAVPAVPSRILKVIHDFTGQEQGDLTIKAGDRVTFVRQVDENWIEGSLNGQRGIFPSKFASDT